jgi:hypothetical protein
MAAVTPESWRPLPAKSDVYAELAAHPLGEVDGVFLAVDHDGARHLLLPVADDGEVVSDERSRGIRAATRPLSVQQQPERRFIDVVCTAISGQDVFNLVGTTIVDQGPRESMPRRRSGQLCRVGAASGAPRRQAA